MNSFNFNPMKNSNNISGTPSLLDGIPLKIVPLPGNHNIFDEVVSELRRCELFIMLAERGSKSD